jgi:hypothetical protein
MILVVDRGAASETSEPVIELSDEPLHATRRTLEHLGETFPVVRGGSIEFC